MRNIIHSIFTLNQEKPKPVRGLAGQSVKIVVFEMLASDFLN